MVALPDQDDFLPVDVLVQNGRIAEIRSAIDRPEEEILSAKGLLVLPGGVDPHVHFDDPGYTEREDFFHGCAAAASGGVTTVIDMPFTSIPPVTCRENLNKKLESIETHAIVDYGLYGGVSSQTFDMLGGMEECAEEVLGIKVYMTSGMEHLGRLNAYQILKILEKTQTLGVPLLVHAEDHDYVSLATEQYRKRGNGPIEYYQSRPETAELLAVRSVVELAKETAGNLHIVHIGTARAAEILREVSGDASCTITGETAPHYLAFDTRDFRRLKSALKVTPSVKSPGNRERLWELLQEGVLSFVASDHAPAPEYEKCTGSIWKDYSGIPGSGTMLPYLYSEGFVTGKLSLRRFLDVVSRNAALRYGIGDRKGSIELGKDADFVLLDPDAETQVDGRKSLSKGRITPFDGMIFHGRVEKTIIRGRIVYDSENGIIADPGYGKRLKKGTA